MSTRDSWPDRHPAAATTAGLFSLTLLCMMLSVHPIAGTVVVMLVLLAGFAVLVDRERQRREACAARAERDNTDYLRDLIATPTPSSSRNPASGRVGVQSIQLVRPRQPAPWHLVSQLPTEPLSAGRN